MDKKMSLVEHLSDLRKTFIYSLFAIGVGSIISYLYVDKIVLYLKKPLPIKKLVFFSPVEAFLVNIKVALLAGLVLAFPVILSSFAWFIAPGLTKKEKRVVTGLGFVSLLLFILGAFTAYFGALPPTLKFLFDFSPDKVLPYVSIKYYISFILNFILVFGLSFQLPFLFFTLVFIGILSPRFIKQQRKYFILILISLSFILAPGADILTQVLLFGPLYIFSELAVLTASFLRKKRLKSINHGGE